MSTWVIINPSDPCTMEADDHDVAAVMCAFLGNGAYGLREVDGDRHVPVMLFEQDNAWFQDTFGMPVDALFGVVIDNKLHALIAAFDSVMYGSHEDRRTYAAALELIDAPAKRDIWRNGWRDGRPCHIASRSWDIARQMREHAVRVAGTAQ